MTTDLVGLGDIAPNLKALVAGVLEFWPEHRDFLAMRFDNPADATLAITEKMAGLVATLIAGELDRHVADYKWMCANFLREDIEFRKTGRYRLSNFEDVYAEVYGNPDYMSRYIRGILLSQVLWANQAKAMQFYVERFLTLAQGGASFLEVGPGHGLFIYFASQVGQLSSLTGWDVSPSSIEATGDALRKLAISKPVNLKIHNILEQPDGNDKFDMIVLSEVLEHLDQPDRALTHLFHSLKPGGLLFLNVPVNSPAPDHIYLWQSPQQVEELTERCGFTLLETDTAPVTGHTTESALRRKVTLNSLIIALRPAD